jgi:hypothetical protein
MLRLHPTGYTQHARVVKTVHPEPVEGKSKGKHSTVQERRHSTQGKNLEYLQFFPMPSNNFLKNEKKTPGLSQK